MPIVQPPQARHTIQDDGSTLRISIPSRKNTFFIVFVVFWLLGWGVGEFFALGLLFAGASGFMSGLVGEYQSVPGLSFVGLFILVWWLIWTAGGAMAGYTFLWQLVGKEILTVSYGSIIIQRAVFRFGRKKEYLAAHIKDLRVTPLDMNMSMFGWSRRAHFWGMAGGMLAFDYGAQTFRFGTGVDEAEAKQILEKIMARFPQYRRREAELYS